MKVVKTIKADRPVLNRAGPRRALSVTALTAALGENLQVSRSFSRPPRPNRLLLDVQAFENQVFNQLTD
jgi:hypothetical protein